MKIHLKSYTSIYQTTQLFHVLVFHFKLNNSIFKFQSGVKNHKYQS